MPATVNYWPAVPYPDFFREAVALTYLTGGNQTINPDTDLKSLYILPAGSMSGAATLTVTNTATARVIVNVLRLDLSANIYTIQNSTPTTLFTVAGSPTIPILYTIFNNAGTWIPNTITYCQTY